VIVVDWQDPDNILNEFGASISFRLSILSIYTFTIFPLNPLSLVDASNKLAHVLAGVLVSVCFLPIDWYYSHRP